MRLFAAFPGFIFAVMSYYSQPRVADYFRRGFTMSRRARKSHLNNEHPLTHWMKVLALDKETVKKMLTYAGYHHTGMYAQRTKFYRLPNWDNEIEVKRFFKTFQSIPATKRKFICFMSEFLQEEIRFVIQQERRTVRPNKNSPEYKRLDEVI